MNRLLAVALCILSMVSCRDEEKKDFYTLSCPQGNLKAVNLLLGNPSNATTDPANANNYLLELDEYTISYSRDRAIPNWVSWHLSQDWYTGNGNRQDDFRANPLLPSTWLSPDQNSYQNSGFDRGHNCPSADRLCSDATNSSTFFMTNMIPQAPYQNQNHWKIWECYFRHWADQGNEVYIVMGNYGLGGDGYFGYREYIQDGDLSIAVPESTWKVAIVIPENDGDDLAAIHSGSTVIAIDIPNSQQVANFDWNDSQFITTVDVIEARMGEGFDLFSALPANVQGSLESQTHTIDEEFDPC